MPAETVNAYHYDVLSRWLLILMWGKESLYHCEGKQSGQIQEYYEGEAWAIILSANLNPPCIRQLSQ